MNEAFEISDYLLGEMEPAEQRLAERVMREDDELRKRVEELASVCSRLEAVPEEAWDPPAPPPLPADIDPAPANGEKRQQRRRKSPLGGGWGISLRPLAAGALAAGLLGAGLAVGLLLDGGGGSGGGEEREEILLNPIASLDPEPQGTLAISGEGADASAELTVSNLPGSRRALYELWLLDSSRGQMSLGTFAPDPSGTTSVELPMPVSHRAYTYVDVSREPLDGDPAHSGDSILRAPTSAGTAP